MKTSGGEDACDLNIRTETLTNLRSDELRVVMLAMNGLRTKEKFRQRQAVDRFDLVLCPVESQTSLRPSAVMGKHRMNFLLSDF